MNTINYSERGANHQLAFGSLATKPLVRWLVALTYASVFSWISNDNLIDYNSYLNYAEYSWVLLFKYADNGLLALLSNEPVWLLINSTLAQLFEPNMVVQVIVFFSSFSFAWLLIKNNPEALLWLLIFLLLPSVVKNYLIHIRQGLAITFFVWGWFSVTRAARWALFSMAAMVHTSFLFIIFFLVFTKILSSARFSFGLRNLCNILCSFVIANTLEAIASLLAARQAEAYLFEQTNASGLGFVFWGIIFSIFIIEGPSYQRRHSFAMTILGFYLVSYWFIEVAVRVFESGLIIVLLAGLELTGWRSRAFRAFILAFSGLLWLIKVSEPGFGFTKI